MPPSTPSSSRSCRSLPCQYLYKEKILLAAEIARETEKRFGAKGRVHFNVGGAQAIEDSMKLIRNYRGGKSLMFAFMGGYHGRTLGCSEITSSYLYRRRYGHFGNRASFIPFPYCYRCFYGLKRESCGYKCVNQEVISIDRLLGIALICGGTFFLSR